MLNFNDKNFEKEVLENKQLVLVAFWRPGCGPCSAVLPIMEDLSEELKGKIKIGMSNVFESPETAKIYKIPAVPTFIIYKNGGATEKAVGLRPKQVFIDKINNLLLISE